LYGVNINELQQYISSDVDIWSIYVANPLLWLPSIDYPNDAINIPTA